MKVRIVSYTQPAPDTTMKSMNLKELIAFTARVSNPSNQLNHDTADKLISYMLKHKHFSPFEMVSVCMEISTTRDIARQILRHRSFSFQEFSQRYADPTKDLGFEIREMRLQDDKNRQNSIEPDLSEEANRETLKVWEEMQQKVIKAAKDAYHFAIRNGVAKEQARAVLPEGLTESRLYMNGTLRSWLHFCELRTGIETQKEHREIANACAKEIEEIFPGFRTFFN